MYYHMYMFMDVHVLGILDPGTSLMPIMRSEYGWQLHSKQMSYKYQGNESTRGYEESLVITIVMHGPIIGVEKASGND